MKKKQSFILLVLIVTGLECFGQNIDENTPGLHVLSEYGNEHILVTTIPSEALIEDTINMLDWDGFHQVFLVLESGASLEVGGSLNLEDGLSSVYRNKDEFLVTVEPPSTVKEMIFIIKSFHRGDKQWRKKYEYN